MSSIQTAEKEAIRQENNKMLSITGYHATIENDMMAANKKTEK